ncbi:MAG: hypothetical protein ABIN25_09295 [Ginsengibacter sp.]
MKEKDLFKSICHIKLGILLLGFSLLYAPNIFSQLPQVRTSVDKNNILIGEQFQYKVETSMPDNSYSLGWFSVPDSFGNFVVVSKNKIDSVVANGSLEFTQVLTLTSFDSGRQVIPPLNLSADPLAGDTTYNLFTDTIPINVSYSPLDSVKTFHDIKSIIEVKKVIAWWVWALIALGVLIIIFLVIFLIKVFKKKKELPGLLPSKLSPYAEAMKALDDLEKEQLLQKNAVKEYHSRLTDIYKRYVTRRTNFNKLHLTSDELLMDLDTYGVGKDKVSTFANCLRMGNAVKFAKYIPPQYESEKCMGEVRETIKQINNYFNTKTASDI